MSAQFQVKYRGRLVTFHNLDGARVLWSFGRDGAGTVFVSESQAWCACVDYQLNPDRCEVVPLSEVVKS